ncbi:MAG: 16S rRNA (guanine(966)-N(2))-methyltransferase RsmD [Rhabdochlamydiaceae bacterium]|nr:16S rRNA (guanine(966)-N(2))-methyltransferase RsmD [Candidatus Amphrikana amoebophyrae]
MKLRITGGLFKGHFIDTPKGNTTRPTSERLRQTLFNIIAPDIKDSTFIDAYSGSGAIAIEAFSRGAKQVYAIEHDKMVGKTILKNIKTLNIDSGFTFLQCDCLKGLKVVAKSGGADIGFFDPPYPKTVEELESFNQIFEMIEIENLFVDGARIFFELPSNMSQINLDPYPSLSIKKSRKVGDTLLMELNYSPKR